MSFAIDIMRSTGLIVTVKPDNSSTIQTELTGADGANLSFELNAMYNFNIGDYALILGQYYYVTVPPEVLKKSKYNYQYALFLEPERYKLRNTQYLFYNPINSLAESDFSLTGTADDFMNLLVLNANRVSPGWIKGGVIATGYQTLTFAKEDCLSVLSKIAQTFETEFYIAGRTINLAKKQQATTHTFMYGRNFGLYTITRSLADDLTFTRLFVYGGTENIPNTYHNFARRLLMNQEPDNCLITDLWAVVENDKPSPGYQTFTFTFNAPLDPSVTGLTIGFRAAGSTDPWSNIPGPPVSPRTLTTPTLDHEFIFTSIGGPCNNQSTEIVRITETTQGLLQKQSVIENNISKYGIIEGTLIVEDIYPTREGVVTSANLTNVYAFTDTGMDFDVNTQLIPGLIPKVSFNTGQLSGYSFEISKYNPTTKEFIILKNKDEKALDIPSIDFRPAIGDKYILLDILMPKSYVDAAEKALRAKAVEYIAQKSEPAFRYSIQCDPAYFRKQNITLEVGDIVRIIDTELQVDKPIRIVNLTRSLIDEFEYTLELGDTITQGTIAVLQATQTINSQDIKGNTNTFNKNALINGTYIGTFKIEQGTLMIPDIETAADTTAMHQLFIDGGGKIWRKA